MNSGYRCGSPFEEVKVALPILLIGGQALKVLVHLNSGYRHHCGSPVDVKVVYLQPIFMVVMQ